MEFDYEEYLDEYFDPMELTDEEKEDRKEIAKEIREAVLFWFWLLLLAFQYAVVDLDNLKGQLRSKLAQVVYNHSTADAYTVQYLDTLTNIIFDTTMKDVNKQTQDAYLESGYDLERTYALSDERATFIGANEADSIGNREEWLRAIEEGKTHKIWKAFIDKRTRKDHEKMDGKKIPIKEYFKFPDCKMLYPHDEVHGSAKQTVNCRCVLKFLKETGEETRKDSNQSVKSIANIDVEKNLLNYNLQYFAVKKQKRTKVPRSNALWDSLVMGDVDKQLEDGVFYWEHGGYSYTIETTERYEYTIVNKTKIPNIHDGNIDD